MKLFILRTAGLCLYVCGMLAILHSKTGTTHCSTLIEERLSFDFPVRVLLAEASLPNLGWSIECSGGFLIYIPENRQSKRFESSELSISYGEGCWHLNEQIFTTEQLYILPHEGLLKYQSIEYDGCFSLTHTKNVGYLVNHLDLEEYVSTVLLYESIPSWPDEVQKALSIACRTYAVNIILHKREHTPTIQYDLKSTVDDQVYRGHERKKSLNHLVAQTKGMVLTHRNRPILAMYTAVCGGIIPAKKSAALLDKASYLKRPYACTFCKEHILYRWNHTLSFNEIANRLRLQLPDLGIIKTIKVSAHDKAGVAQQVIIEDSQKSFSLEAQEFRKLFSKIRSICCTFTTNKDSVTIEGKGHGHHIGLCQWGAYEMVKKGWTYKNILAFYYPQTTLMKLDSLC